MMIKAKESKIKNIIFDYDGTIHESAYLYAEAFRKAYAYLVEKGLAKEREYTVDEISLWLGYSPKEMWNSFMPDLAEEEKTKASSIIGEHMIEGIVKGKAKMYEGMDQVLQDLKESGFRLIFLSNCKISYMNAHREAFHLDTYFDNFYCTEQYDFASKIVIYETFEKMYEGDFMIIGDRLKDIEVGTYYHIPSIGCGYGYGKEGELEEATCVVSEVSELSEAIETIVTSYI